MKVVINTDENAEDLEVSITCKQLTPDIGDVWFPIDLWRAWLMSFSSFMICLMVSLIITITRNRLENKKLEDGLAKLQEQWRKSDEK